MKKKHTMQDKDFNPIISLNTKLIPRLLINPCLIFTRSFKTLLRFQFVIAYLNSSKNLAQDQLYVIPEFLYPTDVTNFSSQVSGSQSRYEKQKYSHSFLNVSHFTDLYVCQSSIIRSFFKFSMIRVLISSCSHVKKINL